MNSTGEASVDEVLVVEQLVVVEARGWEVGGRHFGHWRRWGWESWTLRRCGSDMCLVVAAAGMEMCDKMRVVVGERAMACCRSRSRSRWMNGDFEKHHV